MSALKLFKQAGIVYKVAFDMPQGVTDAMGGIGKAWDGLNPYAQKGLIGAGIGGLGMGAASMFGGDDEEDPGAKRSRVLGNVLKGALLGGAGGVGYQAFKDSPMFGGGKSPQMDKMQQLQQQATANGHGPIDIRPYDSVHPVGAMANKALDADKTTVGGAGALAGMGYNRHLSRLAERATNVDPKTQTLLGVPDASNKWETLANTHSGANHSVKKRILENLIAGDQGHSSHKDIKNFIDTAKISPIGGDANEMAHSYQNIGKASGGKFEAMPKSPFSAHQPPPPRNQPGAGWPSLRSRTQAPPVPASLLEKIMGSSMNPMSTRTIEHAQIPGTNFHPLQKLTNITGQMTHNPFAVRNIARYGKYGLAGAAAGLGAQSLSSGVANAWTRMVNSPEQLEAWRQGGIQ